LGSRPVFYYERSTGALAPDSRLVAVGALCAKEAIGSVANKSPNASVGRFIMTLG
jgi:hypothetical protein